MTHAGMHRDDRLYGIMAEFDSPEHLVQAAEKTRHAGFKRFDAFTPHPVEELHHAMGLERSILPWFVLVGGLAGFFGGLLMQWWINVHAYPLNIGGRPFNSWPAFMPVSFECTILLSAFTAVLGMFALNGLPQPHHAVFNVERFALASRDRYFICVEATDPKFDRKETASFLWSLQPANVAEVPDS